MAEDKGKGASPTIVGGQPPSDGQGLGSEVPTGVELLLSMAAVDPAFATALQERPDETIQASGVTLTASERAILGSVGRGSLGAMIVGVRQVMPDEERRKFLGHSAAAMLLLASGLGGGAAACEGCGAKVTGSRPTPPIEHNYPAPTGSRPDPPDPPDPPEPPEPPSKRHPGIETGIRPDLIESRPTPMGKTTGSRPDLPEPSPRPLSRGISPDRPMPLSRGISPDRPHSPKTGSRPDKPEPPKKPDAGIKRPSPTRGIRPDKPRPNAGVSPDRPRPMPKSRGISPDLPGDDEL